MNALVILFSSVVLQQAGTDATAMAAWDLVPFQVFSGEFRPGVVAFHMSGINRVVIRANNQTPVSVTQMTSNPDTRVTEYWTLLNASAFADGPVELTATAYPVVGLARTLPPITVFANSHGTFRSDAVYVSTSGSDTNPGTSTRPLRTITIALDVVPDGGRVIVMNSGTYQVGASAARNATVRVNQRWITVEAASTSVVPVINPLTGLTGVRPRVRLLRWKNISFDFRTMTYYPDNGHHVWFDGCRWFDSVDWATVPSTFSRMSPVRSADIGGSYVTDSVADHVLYGFTHQNLVRNSRLEYVYGDALQNSHLVLNCTVNNMGGALAHHKDLLQFFGNYDNLIIYGVQASNLAETQSIFLDHDNSSFRNCAFVDLSINTTDANGGPPFSQFNAYNEHVYFRNVRLPRQRILFRTDLPSPRTFVAKNVVFENCEFYPATYQTFVVGEAPAGVTFKSCYAAGTTPPADRTPPNPPTNIRVSQQ